MIRWEHYPKSEDPPYPLNSVIGLFERNEHALNSTSDTLQSNGVLSILENDPLMQCFKVNKSKKPKGNKGVHVTRDKKGNLEESFEVDAYDRLTGTVLDVEAEDAVFSPEFFLFLVGICEKRQADYLIVAVRETGKKYSDFEKATAFLDAMRDIRSTRLHLKGILIIGY